MFKRERILIDYDEQRNKVLLISVPRCVTSFSFESAWRQFRLVSIGTAGTTRIRQYTRMYVMNCTQFMHNI